jgi:GH43 family beta-xylosidase
VGESFIGKTVNATNQHNLGFWYVYKQSTVTDVEKEEEPIPTIFKLEQNYPNPFNPSTVIKFGVPEKSRVLVKVYDILGNEVTTLVNEDLDAGLYSREFNASGYSSGIYIYRMQAGTYINTKKMILVK